MHIYSATLWNRICFNLPSLWAKVRQGFCGKKPLNVLTTEATLRRMLETDCSIARYGDGEWRIMRGGGIGFQTPDKELARRLYEIVRSPDERCLLCNPNIFDDLECYTPAAKSLWRRILRLQRAWLCQIFGGGYLYGDALISRFYMDVKNKAQVSRTVALWKQIWEGRELLIVEGTYSRLGMGSDLFANASSVKRILCPPTNAWTMYDEILTTTQRYATGRLVLISLGPTATVLAYDLAKAGIRAIDCGHFEVEYQWMLMGATTKISLPNRWVNEGQGSPSEELESLSVDDGVIVVIPSKG